ncbi:MAG: PhzF family phenazine biosynthesis protein [Spirulina sp. DLM2.Bin59]|nr:MAG: PhzF family phenazine biosynthesis protein [Spirulina sp. DLM2.Bin59]
MIPFYIVDVFAVGPLTGNPLAVVITAGRSLPDALLQAIAQEMNYSETTFITATTPINGGYPVRIFTPDQELPFAGHPTLGTAAIIREHYQGAKSDRLLLNLQVGQIPVTFAPGDDPLVWMRHNPPRFGATLTPAELAPVLGLPVEAFDPRFPIQEVSTGVPFVIVPVRNLAALQGMQWERSRYFQLIEHLEAKAILIFCPETTAPENDLSVRVFAEAIGVVEDPATGSANGCLAAYLIQHQYFGQCELDVRVEQGYALKRPSLLLLRGNKQGEMFEVNVGGRVIAVAQGELTLPV